MDEGVVPLATPNLTGKEAEYTAQAIASGYVGPAGPFVWRQPLFIERFEEMVAEATGRQWAVATITGTAALHVAALVAIGEEPINAALPVSDFPALRNVASQLGWTVFDAPADADHDLRLIGRYDRHGDWYSFADRAPAIGEPPSDATLECYSFAANKTVTCGQGGAIVGYDPNIEKEIRRLIHQKRGHSIGRFNYRMANINAAIGCAQMERLDEFKERKRAIWNRYRDAGLPMVERGASRWMATVEGFFTLDGIETREEPYIGTSLPCSTHLTEAQQDKVIKAWSVSAR